MFLLTDAVTLPCWEVSAILTEYLPADPGREFVLVTAITVQKSIILWARLKAIRDPILEQNKHSLHYCLGSSGPPTPPSHSHLRAAEYWELIILKYSDPRHSVRVSNYHSVITCFQDKMWESERQYFLSKWNGELCRATKLSGYTLCLLPFLYLALPA